MLIRLDDSPRFEHVFRFAWVAFAFGLLISLIAISGSAVDGSQAVPKTNLQSGASVQMRFVKPKSTSGTDPSKKITSSDKSSKAPSTAKQVRPVPVEKVEHKSNPAVKAVAKKDEPKPSESKSSSETANRSASAGKQIVDDKKANSPPTEKPDQAEPTQQQKIRSEQAKDSGECPGGVDDGKGLATSPDDIPLDQSDHPFDAPTAVSKDALSTTENRFIAPSRLTSEQIVLRHRIVECLNYYLEHPESVTRRSPWAVMHATLPFGVETELMAGNRRVNAIGWMCYNGLCKTQRLFQPTRSGFRTNIGPGVQGHEGQLLAILAQSRVDSKHPIRVGQRQYTVADLVRFEMANCREKSELTFKLIGLSYYLEPDHRWRDNQGRTWSLEKLVQEELAQPIIGAACGGTHRLMGFSFSIAQRRAADKPITGQWQRAEIFVNDFVSYALTLQNSDGSFSTEWFERRADEPSLEKKVQTTGHILEWLVFTVPKEKLSSEPIERAVRFLLENISDNREKDWPIGPRSHSLRAMSLYLQRAFDAPHSRFREYTASLSNEPALR